jgi:hypothetical protein
VSTVMKLIRRGIEYCINCNQFLHTECFREYHESEDRDVQQKILQTYFHSNVIMLYGDLLNYHSKVGKIHLLGL